MRGFATSIFFVPLDFVRQFKDETVEDTYTSLLRRKIGKKCDVKYSNLEYGGWPSISRPVASGGAVGARAPHFLADQLTLSQQGGGTFSPPSITCPPPDCQTLRRPCFFPYSRF